MIKSVQVQEAFKVALSMTLFFWLALAMNWDMPGNGGMAIALVSLGTAGASLQKGLLRIVGTTIGLLVGLLVVALFAQDCWLTLLFLSAYFTAVSYFMPVSRYGYAYYVAGFVPAMVWASSYMNPDNAFHYASFRYLETTTGIVIYTLVCVLLWPKNAGTQLITQGETLLTQLQSLFACYRMELEGKSSQDAADLRSNAAASFSQVMMAIQAACADTPAVRVKEQVWEQFRLNLRTFGNSLELWHESIADNRHLDIKKYLPELDQQLDSLNKRLKRISEIWKTLLDSEQSSTSTKESAELLNEMKLSLNTSSTAELSHFDAAALMCFAQQLQILDQSSAGLLRTMQVLAGDAVQTKLSTKPHDPNPYKPLLWDPHRLVNALFPTLCFIASYIFWIYVDPPTGINVPSMTITVALCFLLGPMNPIAMLMVLLITMWVFVAPIYFFLMPALGGGSALLLVIFAFTFLVRYLGVRYPAFKLMPLVLFVNLTGISNDQHYSFMGFVDGALMLILVMVIINVVYMLWTPSRPEKALLRGMSRFFRGCSKIIEGFSYDQLKGQKSRKLSYQSMIAPFSRELLTLEKKLDYKTFPDNTPEKVKRLVNSLQRLSNRLVAVDVAHSHALPQLSKRSQSLHLLGEELKELLKNVFSAWTQFQPSSDLDQHRLDVQQLSNNLEKELASDQENIDSDDSSPGHLYALVGSIRSLVEAMSETQQAMKDINWDQWEEIRF